MCIMSMLKIGRAAAQIRGFDGGNEKTNKSDDTKYLAPPKPAIFSEERFMASRGEQ